MAARTPPTGRLRPAPPMSSQPLGSSGLAVDSRLLLGVPLTGPASLPRESRPFSVSAFWRHVIDDKHPDYDADQQRRQKKIFHFDRPLHAATLNSPCSGKVRRDRPVAVVRRESG